MKTDYHLNDILYCKKTLKYDKYIYFIKNKTYKINYINNDTITILSEQNDSISFCILSTNYDQFKLNDHFYTKNQYRKQKLLKLKKS
jgi:hypothetical protein